MRRQEGHGIQSMHVRPGHQAMLINISAGGALIETGHRLLPGSNVDLVLDRSRYRATVRGRRLALHCGASAVSVDLLSRRDWLRSISPWFVEHERVDITQQVVTT